MDKKEIEFLTKLLATFKIEAEEHLKNLTSGLLTLEEEIPEEKKKELLEQIFREAHSLKGAARAVSFASIEKICQALENVLAAYKKSEIQLNKSDFDNLYSSIDLITDLIEQNQREVKDIPLLNQLTETLYLIASPKESKSKQEPEKKEPSKQQKKTISPVSSSIIAPAESTKTEAEPEIQPQALPSNTPSTPQSQTQHSETNVLDSNKDKTIRVASHKLDRLLQQVEEMLIVKLTASQRLYDLKSIQDIVDEWDKDWSKIQADILSIQTALNDPHTQDLKHLRQPIQHTFDFLKESQEFVKTFKANINKWTKAATSDHRIVNSLVDNLLDDTKKVLMQPFSTLLESFPRMARDLSRQLEKEVHLELFGGDIEVDRRILEELKDPFIHLIRNSIDHGIEKPKDREKYHKPTQGKITIAASQVSGNSVEIIISDDGAGINLEKIKQIALKQGMITEHEIQILTSQDVLSLIFQSGISTSPIITELSGRGLGLGIVSEKVEKLGGQIFVETKEHEGTTFKIVLPLTLATFRGIHIKAADQDFIIPTQNVRRVIRIHPQEIKKLENKETITLEGKTLSFISLAQLLNLPLVDDSLLNKELLVVLIIKAADTSIAVGVDQVLNEQEVLVKGLGKQLARVQNISAATVTEWGKVIPILDPFDLVKIIVKSSNRQRSTPSLTQQETKETKKYSILIAEDSVTARILLKNILESAGYEVKTAVDGAEAFSMLKTEAVDLLLSDVEMPRMDGFQLTEKVRKSDNLKDLPIVLCTSRGSREDREHGIEVGANAYIDKSSFAHSNLLDIIAKLL